MAGGLRANSGMENSEFGVPALRTSAITGEFTDPRAEREFRVAQLPETVSHARYLFLLAVFISLVFLAGNLATLDGGPILAVVVPRMLALGYSLFCFFSISRVRPGLVQPLIISWQAVVTVTSALLVAAQQNIAELAVLLLPALFYVGVPTSFRATVIAGALCGIVMMFSYAGFDEVTSKETKIGVALLLMTSMLWLMKAHSSRLLRRAWAAKLRSEQALAELAESQRVLEGTFMAVPTPLIVTDIESSNVVKANEAADRFFRVGPGGLVGRPASEFYADAGDRPRFTEILRRHGAVRRFRTMTRTLEGEQRSVLLFAGRLGSQEQSRIITSVLDITEIEERERQLRSAKEEYETLFENSVVGIYRSTPNGRMLRANPALVRFNGYASEVELISAVGDIAREWYVQPGRREEWLHLMRTEGRVTDFVSEVYRHRGRERVWISENSWTVWGNNGNPLYFEGTLVEATDRKRAEAQFEHMARHDQLTNLANRRLLTERLEEEAARARRHGGRYAVMCIDLDRFKPVNDAFGHGAGDLLLQEVARRLKSICRGQDTVARIGGDEFAVLVTSVESPAELHETAARILRAFSQPFVLDGPRAVIGASIGIAVAPDDGTDPKQLLESADKALYRAKGDGRNRYRFNDPEIDAIGEGQGMLKLAEGTA